VDENSNSSRLFLVERRGRERRALVNVAVDVTFETGDGNQVTERTFIEDVSDLGCRFTTRAPAHQGGTVSLKFLGPGGNNLPNEEPRHYRIMWVAPHGRGSTVGARLVTGEKPVEIAAMEAASSPTPHSK
jgi:PilZ domain